MEAGLNRNLKWRFALSILSGEGIERPANGDRFLYFVQSPGPAQRDEFLGIVGCEGDGRRSHRCLL
jgi:hypothetical protein